MNGKNDLFEELNVTAIHDNYCGSLDIGIHNVKQNVKAKLDSAYTERKSYTMKSIRKIAAIAIVAALVLGITVFAANGAVSSWFSSSSSVPDYKSLPTAKRVVKDIGYEPVLIESFENGYIFKDGSVVNNALADENDKTLERFKSVSFNYEKDGDRVIFVQNKFNSDKNITGEIIDSVGNTDIYYSSYTNKIVPNGYTLTDDDKRAEENGGMVFSYGSAEVKVSEVQSVTWIKDGILFELLQIDGKLSTDELGKMAEEILNQ